jgi:putative membrane protein
VLGSRGAVAPGRHRIHPIYIAINLLRVLPGVLFALIFSAGGLVLNVVNGLAEGNPQSYLILVLCGVGLSAIIGLTLLGSLIYYLRFSWEIGLAEISVYSGLVFRKQVHIPFARVQSIDYRAGLIERIAGIVSLKIETAGGASNTGVTIPALRLAEAEALRAEVFRRKQTAAAAPATRAAAAPATRAPAAAPAAPGAAASPAAATAGTAALGATSPAPAPAVAAPATTALGAAASPAAATAADRFVEDIGQSLSDIHGLLAGSYVEQAPVEYQYGLTARELMLTSLSSDYNVVILFVIIGALAQVFELIRSITQDLHIWQRFWEILQQLPASVILVVVVVLVALTFVASTVATMVSYGGFKVRRRGGRIELEHGLLTRQYRGVAIGRIQSLEVSQGFIRRCIGYAQIRLRTIDTAQATDGQAAARDNNAAGLLIHPFIKMKKVDALLAQLLPEYAVRLEGVSLKPLPRKARHRALGRFVLLPCLVTLTALLPVQTLLIAPLAPADIALPLSASLWTLFAAEFAFATGAALLWYRHAAYNYQGAQLVIKKGGYGVVTSFIFRQKIQWAEIRQNPLQRLSGVASIVARTAAGVGGTTTLLRDVSLADAQTYLDWVRPRG